MTTDTVSYTDLERYEVEAVDVFPVIEAALDFPGVPEEKDGVEPELIMEVKRLNLNLFLWTFQMIRKEVGL